VSAAPAAAAYVADYFYTAGQRSILQLTGFSFHALPCFLAEMPACIALAVHCGLPVVLQ
jgi:hypothetical protein